MMRTVKTKEKGFSLVEIIFAVAILTMILVAVANFQLDIFRLNDLIQGTLFSQNEARKILRPFANEVRGASQSSSGSYAIEEAATSTFTFYSDTNSDGVKERIRYFLDGSDFKKGIIVPTGNPYTYDEDDEEIIEVIHNVQATSTIFTYYDENYAGTASSTPLSDPVPIIQIRLVRIDLVVDDDLDEPPAPIWLTTQVSIRNLKTNL